MTKTCPQCNQDVPDYSKFCPHCSFAFGSQADTNAKPEVKTAFVACDICGELNNEANSVCSGCGAPLTGETVNSSVTQPGTVKAKDEKPALKANTAKKAAGKNQPVSTQPVTKDVPKAKMLWIFAMLVIAGVIMVVIGISMNTPPTESPVMKQSGTGGEHQHSNAPDLSLQPKIDSLEQMVKSSPEQKELLLQLARVQDDARFYDRAIQTYKKYIAAVPGNPDAIVDMGVCYFNLQNLDEAEVLFKSALKIKADHTQALFNLGIISLNKEKPDEASKWLNKVIESAPGTREAEQAKTLLQSHTKQ